MRCQKRFGYDVDLDARRSTPRPPESLLLRPLGLRCQTARLDLLGRAAGLLVAIPALVAYRYLRGRVDALVIQMEKESIKLVQAIDRTSGTRPSVAQDDAA